MTREDIIAAARGFLGVPFVHQGRTRIGGVDCIGLVLNVGWQLGFLARSYDVTGYARMPDGSLFAECDRLLVRIPAAAPGCIVAMRFSSEPQHIGIVGTHAGSLTIIHSLSDAGKVAEHRMSPEWRGCIVGCFDAPGVS